MRFWRFHRSLTTIWIFTIFNNCQPSMKGRGENGTRRERTFRIQWYEFEKKILKSSNFYDNLLWKETKTITQLVLSRFVRARTHDKQTCSNNNNFTRCINTFLAPKRWITVLFNIINTVLCAHYELNCINYKNLIFIARGVAALQ